MAKYKITYDKDGVFHKNEIYDGKTFIDHFIETCNEMEDADFLGYLQTTDEDDAINQICDFLNIKMEKSESD